jgi:hypothetical protein
MTDSKTKLVAAALGGAVVGGALVALATTLANRRRNGSSGRSSKEVDDGSARYVKRVQVDTNISRHFVYPRDVRAESRPGALTNPHVEYPSDPFDRQRVMELWDQVLHYVHITTLFYLISFVQYHIMLRSDPHAIAICDRVK